MFLHALLGFLLLPRSYLQLEEGWSYRQMGFLSFFDYLREGETEMQLKWPCTVWLKRLILNSLFTVHCLRMLISNKPIRSTRVVNCLTLTEWVSAFVIWTFGYLPYSFTTALSNNGFIIGCVKWNSNTGGIDSCGRNKFRSTATGSIRCGHKHKKLERDAAQR